jgi:hypothetical protein
MTDNLNELIALVYEASVSPSSWVAFLSALTESLGGTAAGLLHHKLNGVFSGSVGRPSRSPRLAFARVHPPRVSKGGLLSIRTACGRRNSREADSKIS